MKERIVIANWKMNMLEQGAIDFCAKISKMDLVKKVIIATPAPYISILSFMHPNISLAAQDISIFDDLGAYTGEISAAIMKSAGARYAVIGHSERRLYANETNDKIAQKIYHCLKNQITPIICIGESVEARKSNSHIPYIQRQLDESIPHDIDTSLLVIAYEPLWAIGTGVTPTNHELDEVCDCIISIAKNASLVYGGSVNIANTQELLNLSKLDGLLVGGGSLVFDNFVKIVELW